MKPTRVRIHLHPSDNSKLGSTATSGLRSPSIAPRRRVRIIDVLANESGDETGRSLMLPNRLVPRRPATKVRDNARGIGYGNPPSEHAWKPGQSGNPRGRPKGRKNEATILREILARKVTFRVDGKPKSISILEAILYRLSGDAMGGKVRSAEFILKRFGLVEGDNIPAQEMSGDDRAVLEAFAQRFKDSLDGQPE